jgi:hypothetical protein
VKSREARNADFEFAMRLPSTYLSLRAACSDGANRMKIQLKSIYKPKAVLNKAPYVTTEVGASSPIPLSATPNQVVPPGTLGARTQTDFTIVDSIISTSRENIYSSPAQRLERREKRKKAREAAAFKNEQLPGVIQRFENNYVELKKLEMLLQTLFLPSSYCIEVCFL